MFFHISHILSVKRDVNSAESGICSSSLRNGDSISVDKHCGIERFAKALPMTSTIQNIVPSNLAILEPS